MNATILNREFKHPADNWYQIEPKGEHPNRAAKIVQVIDDTAVTSIVNRFNADAEAGNLSHGHEMLIDHEHFKHQADKETIAYGWLQKLANRADGIYGQIRWSGTGQTSVDAGDYRFFSTEYDPADLKVLNDGKVKRVRPLKLDGLTLTNDPNNKRGKPITNRVTNPLPAAPADKCCPDCKCQLIGGQSSALMTCPECKTNFASVSAPAASEQKNNQVINRMKNIANKLGLAAEASEEAILVEVTKLLNRVTELAPLADENATLKNRLTAIDGESVDTLLAAHGVTEEKVLNRLKPVIAALPAAERATALVDFGFKKLEAGNGGRAQAPAARVLNRGNAAGVAKPEVTEAADEQAKVEKIRNRCSEIQKSGVKFDVAWAQAVSEIK